MLLQKVAIINLIYRMEKFNRALKALEKALAVQDLFEPPSSVINSHNEGGYLLTELNLCAIHS